MQRKPLYRQIYEDITQKIRTGFYQPNDRLPSEKQLDEMYQASRTPVRQALNQLESDGYIYRMQGKGSFVAQQGSVSIWANMTGLRTSYMEKGHRIVTQTLEVQPVQNPRYAQMLEVPPDSVLTYLKRIRYFDEQPVLYLEHYLHPKLPIQLFTESGDFLTIQERLQGTQLMIMEADEEVDAVEASTEVASHLQLPPHTPVLKVTRVSYDQNGLPIDINRYYVHTEIWKYRVRFQSEDQNDQGG